MIVGILGLGLIGGSMAADALTPPLAAQASPIIEGFLQEPLNELLASGSMALENADGFLPHIAQSVLDSQDWSTQTSAFLSDFTLAVAEAVLHPIVFLIAFILILIIWHFISHALDLVVHLPVLSTLNAAGGFLMGAVKGILILLIAFFLIQTFRPGLIPADLLAGSRILIYIQKAPAFF